MHTSTRHIKNHTTGRFTAIRERIADGADMIIDFATLGEYGYEPVEPAGAAGAPRTADCRPEPCAPGRSHGAARVGDAHPAEPIELKRFMPRETRRLAA